MARVTGKTITDEQLLRLGRSLRDGTINDAIGRYVVAVALGLTIASAREYVQARACAAEMWNRRSA